MKIFLIKNYNLLMSKVQKKPSALKREHAALEKMKLIYFFLCSWSFLSSGSRLRIQIRIRIQEPTESGSNPDPDTVHSTGSDVTFFAMFRFDPGDAPLDDASVPRGDNHRRCSEPGIRPDLPSGGFWLSGHKQRGHVTHPRAASFPANATGRRQRSEL